MDKNSLSSTLNRIVRIHRWSFRWKIVVPFFLLGLWLMVGGALIISNLVFQNANERFNNQLIEGGKIATEWMVKEETDQLEALRFLSFTSGVSEAVAAGDAEKLRNLTFTIALNKQLEAVEFLDLTGNLLFSMRHQPNGPVEDYRFVRNGDNTLAQYNFVQKALGAKIDQRGDKFAGLVQQDRDTFFYVSGPIYDNQNRVVGGILVGITSKTLMVHLREQTFARISLYRPDSSLIVGSFTETIALEPTQTDLILNPQNNISFTRSIRSLETDFVELISPWNARGENMGVLGVSFAKPAFINPNIPTRVGMIIFVVAVFILIILIGFFIANYLSRPLVNLTHASQEVSRGNLQIQVSSPKMNDELSDLTHTFNGMVVSLNQAQNQILGAYDNTLVGLTLALEMREKQTAMHDRRVAEMSVRLAMELGLHGEELINIRRGALLHDIGKIGIPDYILNKPGPLSYEEMEVMQKHPDFAMHFLSQIEYLRPALNIPHYHHEKWDGTGYPCKLAGEEIPFQVRIFSIIDVWDAIRSDRVYRKAMTPEAAIEVIRQGSGSYFDPQVVDAFLRILPQLTGDLILPEDSPAQA